MKIFFVLDQVKINVSAGDYEKIEKKYGCVWVQRICEFAQAMKSHLAQQL